MKNNSGIHPTEILSNEITHTSTSENLFTPEPTLKTFPLRTFDSAIPPLDEIDTTKLRIRQVIEQIAQIRHSGNISVRDSTDSSADLELTEQPPEYNFESTVVPVLEPPQPLPDWVTWVQLEPQKSVQTTTTITTNPTTTTETVVRQTSSVKPRKAAELASLLMANRLVISRDQAKSSDTPENLKQTRSDGKPEMSEILVLKIKKNFILLPCSEFEEPLLS